MSTKFMKTVIEWILVPLVTSIHNEGNAKGTRSFVGSLKMPNSTFGESHALYNWFSRYSPAPAEVKTVETTLRLHLDNAVGQAYPGKIFVDYGSIVVVSFNNLTSGLGVDFRLTTYSDQYQEPPSDLENLLDVLQLAMKTFTGGHIDLQSIILLSAEYCYPTRITDGDVMITFPMSSPGTIPSEQICGTTGQPLGELTCVGNFTIGLSWVSPRVIPCNEQESSVTGTLRNLSKVAFNVSNIKSLTKEIAEVTSNASTELNYADIIYVSRMVSRVTLLVNVSQQVVKNVLHIFDNVMRANDSVIANSQEVDGASSRLTRAMEIITGRVHIDLSSSFVQTLPNIAIGTFYVGVNETNKVSGIQLFTNATSDGIRKTSVQPLYNVGVNRSINSTDLTIKLPMSLVDPKGVLHLFNETRNTKILFSKKVTVASTNVSDCAFQCTGKLQSTMSSEVCVGFNFNRALKTCELCNTFTSYEYLAPEVGWSSYVYVPEWSLGQQTSFILYNNWKLFQTRFQISANYSSVRKWETYSKVISAKINTRSAMQLNLEDPLTTSFLPVKRDNATNVTTVCGYWDYQLGDFSQEGCWSNGTVGLRHVCMCDHLTNFALLLDVHSTFIAENYYETSADRDEDEPDKPSDDDKPTDEGPAEHQTTIGYDLAEQVSTIGQDPDQQVTPNDEEQEANGASVDKGQDVKETGVDIDQNGNGTSVGNGQDVNGAGVDQGQNVNGTGVDIDQNGNGTSVGNVQDVNGTGVDQGQNVNGTGVGKDQDENESSVGNIHGLDGTTVDKGQDVNGITIDPGQGVHDEDTTQGKNSTTANNNHGTYGNYMDEGNKLALSVISIAGLSLSIVGLLCTIVTFLLSRFFSGCCTEHSYGRGFRALGKGPSQQTIFNLSLALLLSVVLFLGGVEQVKDKGGCIAVAVLLHYLILVSFAWMLVEGVLQYVRFVKVMATYIPGFMKKAYLLAWGVPLLFTVIPLAVNPGLYGGKNCWLSRDLFYFAFMVPVCTVIFVNSVIFVLVIRSFTCGRKKLRSNQSERTAAILRLNAGISTLFLLGITWVFGFLAINEARIAFQYIFCICNSLQGFFIFIFFNVREKQVRDAWCSLLCRRKRKVNVISISPQSQSKRNTPTKTTVLADGLNSDEYKPSDALNSDTYSLSSGVNSDEYRSSGGLNSEKYTPSDHLKLKELTSPDVLNSAKCMSSSGRNSDKHTPSEGLNSYKYMPSCDLELEEYTLSDDGN